MTDSYLDSIATVTSGFAFRTKIRPDPAGDYLVIQARDIRDNLTWDQHGLMRVSLPTNARPEGKLLEKYDILLMTRSEKPYAVIIDQELPPTVAQNSFCTIRVNDPMEVLPQYLAMILNQSAIQNRLRGLVKGTTISYIRVGDLRHLAVPVPPLDRQHSLVGLQCAISREARLSRMLEGERLQLLDRIILG